MAGIQNFKPSTKWLHNTCQLESRTSLTSGTWGSDDAAIVGEGGFITVSIPATGEKFFQVKMY